MPMDYGLIGGLGAGLSSGVDAYQKERAYQDYKTQLAREMALKERMGQADLLSKGYEVNKETGEVGQSERQKRKEAFEEADKQAGILKSGYQAKYNPDTGHADFEKIPGFKDTESEYKKLQVAKLQQDLNAVPTGKIVPAAETAATGNANASIQALDDVGELVNHNTDSFGPISGRVGGLMGLMGANASSAGINATLKQRAQIIGKYLEGGKLTDSDIKRYEQSIPQLSDTPDVARSKIASLKRLIAQKQQGEVGALQGAGYSTAGIPTSTPVALPGLGKRPQGLISEAAAKSFHDMSDSELMKEWERLKGK